MEKFLLNKEHMRMAMLNHEATFKEQVYELHRLYQIQKILMRNIRDDNQKRLDSDQRPIRTVDYGGILIDHMRDDSDGGDDVDCRVNSEVEIDESEIELTLGPTVRSRPTVRRSRNPDTDVSDETASLGFPMKKSSNNNNNNNNNNNVGNVDEELKLKHHPPWFFQVLSMNMNMT